MLFEGDDPEKMYGAHALVCLPNLQTKFPPLAAQNTNMNFAFKRDRGVFFHAYANKFPGNILSPKNTHKMMMPALSFVQMLATIGSWIYSFTDVQYQTKPW